jgi:seryl-tRNA synthetase
MINYLNLNNASKYYSALGYNLIETPWYVTEEIKSITCPKDKSVDYHIDVNDKYLVASGEQSFLYLLTKGQLPLGRYQTITPCFRFENYDILHKKCFMKNELIHILDKITSQSTMLLQNMIDDAVRFFQQYTNNLEIILQNQDNSICNYDILLNGIEIGSYGIRQYKNLFFWIYGTGIAEPRFSTALKIKE